jgi:hypothetical protein
VGLPRSVTKQLTAASATNIAASQSPGAGPILINGTASNRVSTTTTAAAAAGSVLLALTTVTGVVVGSTITDTTAAVIPAGTTVVSVDATNLKVQLSNPVGGAGVGNGDTIVIGGVATLDTQRRIILVSGGNDSGITFTIFGAGDNGVPITETIAGANAGTATSNINFKTITNVTHTGSVAGTLTIGTNTAGDTPWMAVNWHTDPVNIELAGIVAAGQTVTWSWQYTYDDPNNLPAGLAFPQPFNHPTLNNQANTTLDGSINDPVAAVRLSVVSGTGLVRGTINEAGLASA